MYRRPVREEEKDVGELRREGGEVERGVERGGRRLVQDRQRRRVEVDRVAAGRRGEGVDEERERGS